MHAGAACLNAARELGESGAFGVGDLDAPLLKHAKEEQHAYSGLMFPSRTTVVHLAMSALTSPPNASGLPVRTSKS